MNDSAVDIIDSKSEDEESGIYSGFVKEDYIEKDNLVAFF